MKFRDKMLATIPIAILMPILAGQAAHAQYFGPMQPAVEQKGLFSKAEASIKLPYISVRTTPIPEMSTSSAVRVACGAAIPFDLYRSTNRNAASDAIVIPRPVRAPAQATVRGRFVIPTPSPSPAPARVNVNPSKSTPPAWLLRL